MCFKPQRFNLVGWLLKAYLIPTHLYANPPYPRMERDTLSASLPGMGLAPFHNASTLTRPRIPVDDDIKTMIISFYVS